MFWLHWRLHQIHYENDAAITAIFLEISSLLISKSYPFYSSFHDICIYPLPCGGNSIKWLHSLILRREKSSYVNISWRQCNKNAVHTSVKLLYFLKELQFNGYQIIQNEKLTSLQISSNPYITWSFSFHKAEFWSWSIIKIAVRGVSKKSYESSFLEDNFIIPNLPRKSIALFQQMIAFNISAPQNEIISLTIISVL